MKNKSFYWIIIIVFVVLQYSCNKKKISIEDDCYSCIDSFRINQHPTVDPNSIAFRICTNDSILGKALNDNKLTKIRIKGSFFNDTTFYLTKPNIKNGEDRYSFYIFSHTSNYIEYRQNQLDSISNSSIKDISIFIQNRSKKWVLQKCLKQKVNKQLNQSPGLHLPGRTGQAVS